MHLALSDILLLPLAPMHMLSLQALISVAAKVGRNEQSSLQTAQSLFAA